MPVYSHKARSKHPMLDRRIDSNLLSCHDEPTWLALRYHVVNPAAFLLHCHIQVHLRGGGHVPGRRSRRHICMGLAFEEA